MSVPLYGLAMSGEPSFPVTWPSTGELLAADRTRWCNVGRRLRTHWNVLRSRRWRFMVEEVLLQYPYIEIAMRRNPILFRPLVSHFIDARLRFPERFAAYAHDLQFSATRLHRAFPDFFRIDARQLLWADASGAHTIELTLNRKNPQEGLWRVILTDQTGHDVFSACFSVLRGPQLFIGAVQGGNAEAGADPLRSIRVATKHFAGLRPQCVLLHVLRFIATAWGIGSIIGVSNQNQLTLRTRPRKRSAIRFCYDTFFQESRACVSDCGNWDVPLRLPPLKIDDIPSRKRAMYRRRSVIVCDMRARITSRLSTPSPGKSRPGSYFGADDSGYAASAAR